MPIDWGNSLVFNKTITPDPDAKCRLWVDLCKPAVTAQLVGNTSAVAQMKAWFANRRTQPSGNACLVVKGPSGVGKSTCVELCAKEHGFHVEHTYANVPRTPQKMESILRKLTMGGQASVLVLDDFESFISETTSMRDIVRFARSVTRQGGCDGCHDDHAARQTMVIVCNDTDKSFEPLFNISTVIQFERADPVEVQRVLRRVAVKVAPFARIPPMDIFFIAHGSTGNIAQTISQMQFSHNKMVRLHNKKRLCEVRRNTNNVHAKCEIDSAFRNWSTTHRSSSIDCFTKEKGSVVDHIWSMSRGFHMDVRDNLHTDYPLYFHNSTRDTLDKMWKVADEVSACDTAGPDEEDALYTTENRELWGRDNSFAVAHISMGIWQLQGRKRTHVPPKRRKAKKTFRYW